MNTKPSWRIVRKFLSDVSHMRTPPHLRQWLLYFFFAAPVIFMPWGDFPGLAWTWYSLGWPVGSIDLEIGRAYFDSDVHLRPTLVLPLAVVFWMFVASLAWRARLWAMARSDWLGAFAQASLTSMYCAVIFLFGYRLVPIIWDYHCISMSWSEFERAAIFARRWLVYFYLLGVIAIYVTLFLDSRTRRGPWRLTYIAFALCFAVIIGNLSPYVEFQLRRLDDTIHFAQKNKDK